MTQASSWHLLTYDVRDPKRLRRVAKLLEGYGERVQLSVFRVRATKSALEKLKWQLAEIMAADDDLLVIPLCQRCACQINAHSRGDHSDWAEGPPTFEIL